MPILSGRGLAHFIQLFKNYFGTSWSMTGDTNDKMISSGEDLNDYTTIGNYYCRPDTSEAANVGNNPADGSFVLKVYSGSGYSQNTAGGNYLTQYVENMKGVAWIRYKTTGSWSEWAQIATTKTDSVGSGTTPIYFNSGTPTASSSGVGSGIKPIYLSNGTITVSGSTVGEASKPSYLKSGTLTACDNVGTSESVTLTKSTQSNRNFTISNASGYDSSTNSGGSGSLTGTRYLFYTYTGISAGTYTVGNVLQQLVNMSHTHETVKDTYNYNCNCNCNCDNDSDGE